MAEHPRPGRRSRWSPPSSPTPPATAAWCATTDGTVTADRRAGRRHRGGADDPRGQLRRLRVRRRVPGDGLGRLSTDEQPGRALPHRPHQDRARRRPPGARGDLPRRVAGARGQRPRPARRAGRRAQPQAAGARGCAPASRWSIPPRPGWTSRSRLERDVVLPPGHPAARRDHRRRRRGDRPGHHAHRRRGRARRPRGAHPRQRFGDRRGRVRRPVRLPAPGDAARRARQDRHVRRGQERRDRRGLEGAAPHLRRRRRPSASTPTSAPARRSSTTTASANTAR